MYIDVCVHKCASSRLPLTSHPSMAIVVKSHYFSFGFWFVVVGDAHLCAPGGRYIGSVGVVLWVGLVRRGHDTVDLLASYVGLGYSKSQVTRCRLYYKMNNILHLTS